MVCSHDIFKIDAGGSVLWRGAVESFVAAKARIKKLALSSPGEYLVLDQNTGQSVLVMPLNVPTEAGTMEDARAPRSERSQARL